MAEPGGDPEIHWSEAGGYVHRCGVWGRFLLSVRCKDCWREGKGVWIDVNEWALKTLRDRARREGIDNIELRRGMAESIVLCEGCGDVVFYGIVLHDFKDQSRVLMNSKRMLKPGGVLVNLDFRKDSGVGPPRRVKFTEEEAVGIIEGAGFRVEEVRIIEPYSYLIVATPS